MTKHKNFTNYLAELKKEPVTFEFKDKLYTLPASIPLAVMLLVLDLQKKGQDSVTPDETFELMKLVVGEDQFKDLLRAGITLSEMEAVFTWALDIYNGGNNNPKK